MFLLFPLGVNAETKHISMKGKLGESISFRIDLEHDIYMGTVMGETTYYRKNGKVSNIKVYGFATKTVIFDDDYFTLELDEFDGTKMCGHFYILVSSEGRFDNGQWSFGEKTLQMNEIENLPTNNAKNYLQPLNLVEAQGVYEYSVVSNSQTLPEYSGVLQIYVQRKNFAFSISTITPNIAETKQRTSEFFKEICYFYVGKILYNILSYRGAIFVKRVHENEGQNYEFGRNADIVGVYIPTGKEPTGDILNMFDEEKEFSKANLPCSVFELNEAWEEAIGGETTFPDEMIAKDIDGDGQKEFILRYIPNRTDMYEVSGKRSAIFAYKDGKLALVAKAEGEDESLSVADKYVIKIAKRSSRISSTYYRLSSSKVDLKATKVDAEIDSYTIEGKTVNEKDFKKQVKAKNPINIKDLDGWIEIPGSQERNENAARG